MILINRINLEQETEIHAEFLKNIKNVLQKIGSSPKTRAIHKLLEEKLLFIGFGTSDVSLKHTAEFGVSHLNGHQLSGLVAELPKVSLNASRSEISDILEDIVTARMELRRLNTTITDTTSIQIKSLEDNLKKLFKRLIDKIDYFTLVDVYFYLYLNTLAIIGLEGKGKNKIYEATFDVFKTIIKKIIQNNHVKISYDDEDLFEMTLDYMFAMVFTEQSSPMIVSKLSKVYSDENIQLLKLHSSSSYKEFKSIAILLTKIGLVNITESAFMSAFKTIMGKGTEKAMDGSFDELVSYIISTNYKSSLFDTATIETDAQARLEQLILNFKKDLILKK